MANPEGCLPKANDLTVSSDGQGPPAKSLYSTRYRDACDLFNRAAQQQQQVLNDLPAGMEALDQVRYLNSTLLVFLGRLLICCNQLLLFAESSSKVEMTPLNALPVPRVHRNSHQKRGSARYSAKRLPQQYPREASEEKYLKKFYKRFLAFVRDAQSNTSATSRPRRKLSQKRGSMRRSIPKLISTSRSSAARLSIKAINDSARHSLARISIVESTTNDPIKGAPHVSVYVPVPRMNRASVRKLDHQLGQQVVGLRSGPPPAVHDPVRHRFSRGLRHSIKGLAQQLVQLNKKRDWKSILFKKLAFLEQITRRTRSSKPLIKESSRIFDKCRECKPLRNGPVALRDGVTRLAEPDTTTIKRILRLHPQVDLLRREGLEQCNVMHEAAQRGYTKLSRLFLEHWTAHRVGSPYLPYDVRNVDLLLQIAQQIRSNKHKAFKQSIELQRFTRNFGLSFERTYKQLEKLGRKEFTFADMLKICGHPLVLSKDMTGNTPLHYAAEGGCLDLCTLLLEYGADVNEQNHAGETPLHYALSSNNEPTCKFLLKHNANVNIARYVSLSLLNSKILRGNFINQPDSSTTCRLLPLLHHRPSSVATTLGKPLMRMSGRMRSKVSDCSEVTRRSESKALEGLSDSNLGECNTLGCFLSGSPLLKHRHPRDILFFRTAQNTNYIKENEVFVLIVGVHLSANEAMRARHLHASGSLFHLLIEKMPRLAAKVMKTYRVPLFRCTVQPGVRDFHQHYLVPNHLSRDKQRSLVLDKMKADQEADHKSKRKTPWRRLVAKVAVLGAILKRLKGMFSITSAFTRAELGQADKKSVICAPKAILYEYSYENAEFRGGWSPTLNLLVRTESSKELMKQAWVLRLLEHKWKLFAKSSFKWEFRLYFLFFMSFFLATYLHVGDTQAGMPVGGYRSHFLRMHSSSAEYVRDLCTILYTTINLYYTIDEYHCYREKGSLVAYFRDGWNVFEVVQLCCVWLLFLSEVLESAISAEIVTEDFNLVVYQDSMHSTYKWRYYDFQTTLLCIVGPQIFIKWIQFARGNMVLGPFVRMIFMMVREIIVFLIVFMVFLLGFAYAFFILQLEGYKTYLSAVFSVFQLSLGSWNWDNIFEGGPTAVILFLMYSVIGTIMMLNLLIAMLGRTYNDVWEDRFLYFHLEKAKATLSIQTSLDENEYDSRFWSQRLYVLEKDSPFEGIQVHRFH